MLAGLSFALMAFAATDQRTVITETGALAALAKRHEKLFVAFVDGSIDGAANNRRTLAAFWHVAEQGAPPELRRAVAFAAVHVGSNSSNSSSTDGGSGGRGGGGGSDAAAWAAEFGFLGKVPRGMRLFTNHGRASSDVDHQKVGADDAQGLLLWLMLEHEPLPVLRGLTADGSGDGSSGDGSSGDAGAGSAAATAAIRGFWRGVNASVLGCFDGEGSGADQRSDGRWADAFRTFAGQQRAIPVAVSYDGDACRAAGIAPPSFALLKRGTDKVSLVRLETTYLEPFLAPRVVRGQQQGMRLQQFLEKVWRQPAYPAGWAGELVHRRADAAGVGGVRQEKSDRSAALHLFVDDGAVGFDSAKAALWAELPPSLLLHDAQALLQPRWHPDNALMREALGIAVEDLPVAVLLNTTGWNMHSQEGSKGAPRRLATSGDTQLRGHVWKLHEQPALLQDAACREAPQQGALTSACLARFLARFRAGTLNQHWVRGSAEAEVGGGGADSPPVPALRSSNFGRLVLGNDDDVLVLVHRSADCAHDAASYDCQSSTRALREFTEDTAPLLGALPGLRMLQLDASTDRPDYDFVQHDDYYPVDPFTTPALWFFRGGAADCAGGARAHFLATMPLGTYNTVSLLHNAGGAVVVPDEILDSYRIPLEKDPKLWAADKSQDTDEPQIKPTPEPTEAEPAADAAAAAASSSEADTSSSQKKSKAARQQNADDTEFDGIDFDEL